MALNEIVVMLYVVDKLYYTVIYNVWEIGKVICKYYDKQIKTDISSIADLILFVFVKYLSQLEQQSILHNCANGQ